MQAHYCAQIDEDGVVVALSQVHSPIDSPNLITVSGLDEDLLGKVYNPATGEFEPPPPPPPAPVLRRITKLAFRNRFSKVEKAGIEFAALDDPSAPTAQRQQAAALRADLKDQEQAVFIDLDDPDTRSGVLTLETLRLIAVGRAAEILDAPVLEAERAT